ncbi:MAG: hypothetical protein HQL84_16830 [Magnetococcales bacterium]|nr:hypothetical protein [Magnetococcales bacterium]MBF0151687.1 hypothetical protein [Magnetococcales bacterium]MBF0347934.1 hypothetical protein [Magnetococcales bacterium]
MRHRGHISDRYLAFRQRRGWFALLVGLFCCLCLHGMVSEGRATAESLPPVAPKPAYLQWVERSLDHEQQRVLDLLTDSDEDAFSAWYEGAGREYVVHKVPALAPALEIMHTPLARLRYALNQIAATHVDLDPALPHLIDQLEVGNLAWAARVHKAIIARNNSIQLNENPLDLGIGRLIGGEAGQNAARSDVVLKELLAMLQPVHMQLYATGRSIDDALSQGDDALALDIYQKKLVALLRQEQSYLNWFGTRIREHQEALIQAKNLMVTHVLPSINQLQGLLAHVTQVSGNLILHQEQTTLRSIPLKPWDHVLVGSRFNRFIPARPPRNHKFLPHPDRVVILRHIGMAKI